MQQSFGRNWWKSVNALQPVEQSQVNKALGRFSRDPDHPGLKLHKIEGDTTGRLHTIRASLELRILLAREGDVVVLLEAGHHDAVYARAGRQRVVVSEPQDFVALLDQDAVEPPPAHEPADAAPSTPSRSEGPGLFDHWLDRELVEAGLDPDRVAAVRACHSEQDLVDLIPDLDGDTFDLLASILDTTPEKWADRDAHRPAIQAYLHRRLTDGTALAGISLAFSPEEAAQLAAAPVEDWMVFLHPDQRTLVDRRYDGPARVRGAAGTGKTVVALHRTAGLAARFRDERDGDPGIPARPILFTTYIRSLPPVLRALYGRLPGARADEVEFLNVHRVAAAVCKAAGEPAGVNPPAVSSAFHVAWRKLVSSDSPIDTAGLSRGYVRDEITAVIKGRGLHQLDDYLALARTGRRLRLGGELRYQIWRLHEEWNRQMRLRDTVDFPDVILRARNIARRQRQVVYRAVVVDEAQDLSLAGLQMLRALVNGPSREDLPDGLFLVGDGAQRIYPGGYTLRQAGVEVRGRTTLLRVNYRNTREIIETAMAVAGHATVDDLDEGYRRGDAPATASRSGVRPVLVTLDRVEDELQFLVDQVGKLIGSGAIGPGDMAVATASNHLADQVAQALHDAGFATQALDDYDGHPSPAVKVGTHFRIKGLEFKVVFLPGLGDRDFPPRRDDAEGGEQDEHDTLALNQLFVAMTRARDGLFLLATGRPSRVLQPGLANFEIVGEVE